MHKHWLVYYTSERQSIGEFKTDCRLTIGQMVEHGKAIAKTYFPRAETFIIWREDGTLPLVKVKGPFACR